MATRPLPDGYTKPTMAAHRRQGSEAVQIRSGLQFALGGLVIEALTGSPRGHGEVGLAIEILADRIGVSASTLRKYYAVAMQWPEAKRRPDVCWTVHERLAYVPSRYTLIRKDPYDPISDEYRWTVNEAEKVGRAVPGTPTTPQERLAKVRRLLRSDDDAADAVKEMLARPGVRSRVIGDRRTRQLLREAPYERGQRAVPKLHAQEYNEDTKPVVLDNMYKTPSSGPSPDPAQPGIRD